ncbi:NAD(P)-dependent oxidoreductase [Cedecea colo]|uniref:NAD(P)-dependent oxidoreductase n=1 Tax=Cedecea colo TaxID=2552946 RepID=A0ABX0VK79_9ENTR|nr:NAD(P)-dependent oxidoreductase [Cedecea colo]NIY47457.1 NAD(P)-dependent oxidoreductase [Cedecea colo]
MKIAIIGFGEAGRIYAQDLAGKADIVVWDKKFLSEQAGQLHELAVKIGVQPAGSLADALADAKLIFSLVTAESALAVAEQAAPLLHSGQIFLDFNSVAPETKRAGARAVTAGAGDYLDVAVMAPVPPKRLGTPLLIGGPAAHALADQLNALGCSTSAGSERIGDVSAIKMCRSVMIKGLEALTTECLSAARQYGVEEAVLSSLHASFPSLGWNDSLPHYFISRVAEHGVRRADEMAEVVKTLQSVGVAAAMSRATQQVQAGLPSKMAKKGIQYSELTPFVWQDALDRLK